MLHQIAFRQGMMCIEFFFFVFTANERDVDSYGQGGNPRPAHGVDDAKDSQSTRLNFFHAPATSLARASGIYLMSTAAKKAISAIARA